MPEVSKNSPVTIKIVGLILSESYQICKLFVQKLRKHYSKRFSEPVVKGFLDMDWVDYLAKLRKDIGGQTWAVKKGVVVFLDDVFVGADEQLFSRFSLFVFEKPSSERIKSLAKQEYLQYLNRNNLLYTFFELSLDGEYMGSLLFELRSDLLPKTALWFAMICDPQNYLGYSYKNTRIHRVCKSGWFQGGRLGLGREAGVLEDESFCYKHDRRGVLSMANNGKDSNRAQFFVTFKPSEWMDEYYVAFGRVVEGSDVLRRIEYTKTTYEHPDHVINIDNCGLVGVGLGRQVDAKTRLKGLTVGEPHIDVNTFMDLVLDKFCEILFERLDEEVKRELHGKWMGRLLWDTVQLHLMAREPIEDVEDENDRPSRVFHPSMFIKGLYGLKEIPDHFIADLLNGIIIDVVEAVDTRDMVRSIVNLLVDGLDYEARNVESFNAKSLGINLTKQVKGIVYNKESRTGSKITGISKKDLFQKSVYKVASQTSTIRKLLSEYNTLSFSQVSSVQEGEEERATRKPSERKEQFQKVVEKVESLATIKKLLTDYQTISVSQVSFLLDEDQDNEGRSTLTFEVPQSSISDVASHTSTVQKLMTDYKTFSVSRTSVGDEEDSSKERLSTRESVIGYIWEAIFKSLQSNGSED